MQSKLTFTSSLLLVVVVLLTAAPSNAHVFTFSGNAAAEPEVVHVAAYEFFPYYSTHFSDHLLGAVLTELNQRQQRYRFVVQTIRPQDRYYALDRDGCCDLMFFESLIWGWQAYRDNIVAGPELSKGADRFVYASDRPPRIADSEQQPALRKEQPQRIGGIVGYHYDFADYEGDYEALEQQHNLYLTNSHRTVVNMLLRGRLDLAVLNDEHLDYLAMHDAELFEQLQPASAADNEYVTQIIFAAEGSLDREWFQQQIEGMRQDGTLRRLFERFGIADRLVASDW